jgi:cysteine-rich repeat protein
MEVASRIGHLVVAVSLGVLLSPSLSSAVCGDGTLDVGEVCDDANLVDGDGCDSNCTPTGCGNGVVTVGETCDDGNLVSANGASTG